MRIAILHKSYPWFGAHTGIHVLIPYLEQNGCNVITFTPRNTMLSRIAGKAYSIWNGLGPGPQSLRAAELEFVSRLRLSGLHGHILYIEDHLALLQRERGRSRWAGTINLPRSTWGSDELKMLRNAPAALVLCREQVEQFSDIIPAERIYIARHGVETGYFKPSAEQRAETRPHLIFVGAWLRNTKMFSRVVPRILARYPDVVFDCVVPPFARNREELAPLLGHPSLRWHQGLSDEELLHLYQTAVAMLMPMEDSTANNAILEAMACGLPVITTDTGGIRSYGGGSVFPLVDNNDDEACLALAERYLQDASYRASIGKACREYATRELDWKQVAKEFIAAYQALEIV
ncbi:MAG: glycosyltransferase family 4 protein [Terracidiphilus sp.]|nr:glycosyltransferase family 4 protein [Terracidiphilus sp.]